MENSADKFYNDYKNSMRVLIAASIGTIVKNYDFERKRLRAFSYYPPMNEKQMRALAVENTTSYIVQSDIAEMIYLELNKTFRNKTIHWSSTDQTKAQRFIKNAVCQAVALIRQQLLKSIDADQRKPYVIVQRLALDNNLLQLS